MLLLPLNGGLTFAHSAEMRDPGGEWSLMAEYQQKLTHIAFLLADLEVSETWLAYFGSGGSKDRWVIDAYLNGLIPLPAYDCDLLALVLNERLNELHLPQLTSYRG